MAAAIASTQLAGNNRFTSECHSWFKTHLATPHALLTTSGTHALELAALLVGIQEGDEVILSSFTFSSTATAFALRGARLIFVDIRPDTLNLDENQVAEAVTAQTRAILPMHYAGVGCEMDAIMDVARSRSIVVIEDAAHGIMAKYRGRFLGTIAPLGCFSFHDTKNLTCGEGGALITWDDRFNARAEIMREKGTDRAQFFRGQVDKYSWVDLGSSYSPSELNAAFLLGQLGCAEQITTLRLTAWHNYYAQLQALAARERLELPFVPEHCQQNAHCFYIKVKDLETRTRLLVYLRARKIMASFHYVPLHSSVAGQKFGRLHGEDKWTTRESERLLRLPLFTGIGTDEVERVCAAVRGFFAV